MLMCDKTVTLIHHEKGVDGDTYDCIVFQNASWYKKTTISTSGDGAKPVNTYECRIMVDGQTAGEHAPTYGGQVVLTPAEGKTNTYVLTPADADSPVLLVEPKEGDFVVLGVVASIEKPSDLKNTEHFRVTAIGDNRRGKLPHWRLSGQ